MRRIILTVFALTFVCGSASAQGPTLDETTTWLTEKLNMSAGYVTKDSKGSMSQRIENARFEGCALSYDYILESTSGVVTIKIGGTYKLALADLKADAFSVDEKEGVFILMLRTKDSRPVIRTDAWLTMLGQRKQIIDTLAAIEIGFNEKELAERVSKAFSHAATLCAKKKEPF